MNTVPCRALMSFLSMRCDRETVFTTSHASSPPASNTLLRKVQKRLRMGKKNKGRLKNKKKSSSNGGAAKNAAANENDTVLSNNDTTLKTDEATLFYTPKLEPPVKKSDLPDAVESSLPLFTKQQQVLVKLLCTPILKQGHLFASWSDPNTSDECKKKLVTQLDDLNSSYPGGLAGYITNARKLLEQSKQGVNPLEGWKPTVPTGQAFEIGTDDYNTVEAVGLKELGSVGFVLVAGGLGERLGYGDIKVQFASESLLCIC